ncbi:Lipid A 3-O-deacylase (PagL) [Desulfacinum hydrothermale DSM 13146]|uniref:Lipid A 3-O-deacylase (PagL) n=1 Tax=Desulfacinum hydrothermale DSM 13146 TaxID=1121390 RepID=A0A1W1XKG6_9BACT|nr:acyloxyacyl hydrolase [Desulfacinum hydrothermale]SMC24456.1 Lipid A 3-O-deacylase (PagL) [Desulfacinum hydrothermale DSM 13146]
MRKALSVAILSVLLPVLVPARLPAAEKLQFGMAVRSGFTAIKKEETFHIQDLVAFHTLPWDWTWKDGWYLNTFWEIHFGLLSAAGEDRVLFSTGPALSLQTPWKRVSIVFGLRPAFLEDHVFGRENVGGAFQFTEDLGVDLELLKGLSVGYRFQHLSNAGIYEHNPGLDFHVFEVRWILP